MSLRSFNLFVGNKQSEKGIPILVQSVDDNQRGKLVFMTALVSVIRKEVISVAV